MSIVLNEQLNHIKPKQSRIEKKRFEHFLLRKHQTKACFEGILRIVLFECPEVHNSSHKFDPYKYKAQTITQRKATTIWTV